MQCVLKRRGTTGGVGMGVALVLVAGWMASAGTGFRCIAAEIPGSATDLAGRVFMRTAPNGAIELFRMLADGKVDGTGGAYRTNTYTYERSGLPSNQAILTFAARDLFSGQPAWRTNRFLLNFETGDAGRYQLQFTINTVPGIQTSEGAFEISSGSNIAPRLWLQPDSLSVPLGKPFSVSLGVAGYDLKFQWRLNGVAIPGATLSSYRVAAMTEAMVGAYTCEVSNALGTTLSEAGQVSLAAAPVITRQPQPAQAFEGAEVAFDVEAEGTQLNYQWTLNGIPLSGQNGPRLVLSRVTAAQAGLIAVLLENNAGSVTSEAVPLEVCATALNSTFQGRPWISLLESNDRVPSTSSRFGPLASPFQPTFTLWRKTLHATARADDNKPGTTGLHNALVRWQDGVLSTLAFTNVLRPDGRAFLYPFYPTDEGAGRVNFQDGNTMFTWQDGTVSVFVNTNTPAPGQPGLFFYGTGSHVRRGETVLWASTLVRADQSPAGIGLYVGDARGLRRIVDNTTDLPGIMNGYSSRLTEDSLNLDETTIVFSTMESISGPGGVYRSSYDGVVTKLLDTGDRLPGLTNQVVGFGDVDVEGDMVFAVVNLRVNTSVQGRVVGFERDGTVRVIGSGEYLGASGPRQVYYGNLTSISRWTDGTVEPVLNTSAVLGCRRVAGFFDVDAQGDDVAIGVTFGDRSVGVYASFGAPESSLTGPRILVPPQSLSVPATTPATLSVVASGPGPITYQWRWNGVPLEGETQPVHTLVSATQDRAGSYDVVVTSGGVSITSAPAVLSLTAPPSGPLIFLPTQILPVPVGTPTRLSVAAAGAPPLAYQWLLGTVPIEGANTPELLVTPRSNALFRVVVSNAGGSITNAVASVQAIPILVSQPKPVIAREGDVATFTVQASGFDQYRYNWFKNDALVPGAIDATLTLSPVTRELEGIYSVQVVGLGGSAIRSDRVSLTVISGGGSLARPVNLSGITLDSGELRFEFQTETGRSYSVESADGVASLDWKESIRVVGDGAVQVIRIPPQGGAGFVRVRSLDP